MGGGNRKLVNTKRSIVFSLLVVSSLSPCVIGAGANLNTRDVFDTCDVSFDVKKTSQGLSFIGKEKGNTSFNLSITNNTEQFNDFTEYTKGNFTIMKLANELRWRYLSPDKKFYELSVNTLGDVELLSSKQTYTGFDINNTFGFRTGGTRVIRHSIN